MLGLQVDRPSVDTTHSLIAVVRSQFHTTHHRIILISICFVRYALQYRQGMHLYMAVSDRKLILSMHVSVLSFHRSAVVFTICIYCFDTSTMYN